MIQGASPARLRAWLRRRRRAADSRVPLRAARDTFDALGALPWSDRASQELRASGETSRQRVPEARDQLSPQEVQVAGLAASGLSNREIGEIGEKLSLSHRTVASHLHRIFPKLGITSRAELPAALAAGEATRASANV
jgi:DNA-binding NarL/FixJ family response regulator